MAGTSTCPLPPVDMKKGNTNNLVSDPLGGLGEGLTPDPYRWLPKKELHTYLSG